MKHSKPQKLCEISAKAFASKTNVRILSQTPICVFVPIGARLATAVARDGTAGRAAHRVGADDRRLHQQYVFEAAADTHQLFHNFALVRLFCAFVVHPFLLCVLVRVRVCARPHAPTQTAATIRTRPSSNPICTAGCPSCDSCARHRHVGERGQMQCQSMIAHPNK
jgi:hypothetical protein